MKSVNLQEFNVEHKSGHWWNETWEASVTISHHWRNGQSGLFTKGELGKTLVPTLNDHTLADSELERLVSVVRRVELLTVGQGTSVVDGQEIAGLREGFTVSWGEHFNLKVFCCG